LIDKGKVKSTRGLINKPHTMQTSSGGIAPPFLTSALDGGKWSASRPRLCIFGETALGTHWTGDWVGLRARLDAI
jgi:hypothetical protein